VASTVLLFFSLNLSLRTALPQSFKDIRSQIKIMKFMQVKTYPVFIRFQINLFYEVTEKFSVHSVVSCFFVFSKTFDNATYSLK